MRGQPMACLAFARARLAVVRSLFQVDGVGGTEAPHALALSARRTAPLAALRYATPLNLGEWPCLQDSSSNAGRGKRRKLSRRLWAQCWPLQI